MGHQEEFHSFSSGAPGSSYRVARAVELLRCPHWVLPRAEAVSSRSQPDPSTGVLTASAFRRAVSDCGRDSGGARDGASLAVLSIKLDRLGDICGGRGKETADRVIQAAAERLVGCVRAQDCVSHAGGGHFRVLLCPLGTAELAASLADKVCHVLRLPFTIAHQRLAVSASVGIGLWSQDGGTAEAVIAQADACMRRATNPGDGYRFDDAGLTASLTRLNGLTDDPRIALERGEFELHYQPRVALPDDRVVSAEALIRWPHPLHGNIPPSAFIPVAESTGFIHELGAWILERACSQAATWQAQCGTAIPVSVNVSGRQLEHPGFPELVRRTLERTGLAPNRLELEITESTLMHRPADVTEALERIRFLGVRTSLDDFGTGYSSLAYLHRFPLDTLKIDRTFINDVLSPEYSGVLLRSIVDLAHALGLLVVVEGVETPKQRGIVEAQGGDEMQG
ncbi:MAG: bifunctional diguanylate cyclase/phosphodiesterase, partial [Halofilum sp. (in: g-proteobacteria)]